MPRPPSPQLLDRLQALLGDKGFSDDADAMAPWLTDWRGKYHGRAAAMLSPATTGEVAAVVRSEEHTSELQSLMRTSYAAFCLKKKTQPGWLRSGSWNTRHSGN